MALVRFEYADETLPHRDFCVPRLRMIHLRVLGTSSLTGADDTELDAVIAQPKRFALFVYLVLAHHGFYRRDRLVSIFWPEADQEHARAALRKSVHVLRRGLGDGVVIGRGDEELAIDRSTIRCDALDFEAAIEAGRPAHALELYQGDVLDGFLISDATDFVQWLDECRYHYRQQAATAAWVLAQRYESESHLTDAIESARRAVKLAPLNERVVQKVIAMLDRVGDRAGAIDLYERFRVRIASDLGVDPAPETRALVTAIRSRQNG
jgi:DNA-binding SARP family transcriptional activator